MMTRVAVALAIALGVAAPTTSATAFEMPPRGAVGLGYDNPAAWTAYEPARVAAERTGGAYAPCPMSSAAEGNANQQTRPVMQYGQTSGGNRC